MHLGVKSLNLRLICYGSKKAKMCSNIFKATSLGRNWATDLNSETLHTVMLFYHQYLLIAKHLLTPAPTSYRYQSLQEYYTLSQLGSPSGVLFPESTCACVVTDWHCFIKRIFSLVLWFFQFSCNWSSSHILALIVIVFTSLVIRAGHSHQNF